MAPNRNECLQKLKDYLGDEAYANISPYGPTVREGFCEAVLAKLIDDLDLVKKAKPEKVEVEEEDSDKEADTDKPARGRKKHK